jgi:uncharacterized phage protein (TIGR02220 family)
MANYHFYDKTLSWKAKGILSNMLSLPDNWDYSLAGLVTLSSDGMAATRAAIKELEEHGYLIRRPIRTDGKISDWEYLIFEKPEQVVGFQQVENQQVENLQLENQLVENQTQLNTKESSTKESITDSIRDIVEYLNLKLGTGYKPGSQATQKHIRARLAEGFQVEDFRTVIDKKCAEWMGDPKMEKYLRPETLFGTKFEGYLNSKTRRDTGGKAGGYSGEEPGEKPGRIGNYV